MNISVKWYFIISLLICYVANVLSDAYFGMYIKGKTRIVANDHLYKIASDFSYSTSRYARRFNCQISFIRVLDKMENDLQSKVTVLEGGIGEPYIELLLESPIRVPIAAEIVIGCYKTTNEQIIKPANTPIYIQIKGFEKITQPLIDSSTIRTTVLRPIVKIEIQPESVPEIVQDPIVEIQPVTVPEIVQDALVEIQPVTVPEIVQDPIVEIQPVTVPEIVQDAIVEIQPVTVPEIVQDPIVEIQPVTVPEIVQDAIVEIQPVTVPEIVQDPTVEIQPVTVPEIVQDPTVEIQPVTVPEIVQDPTVEIQPVTVPEIVQDPTVEIQPVTVPEIVQDPTVEIQPVTVPEIVQDIPLEDPEEESY